MKGSDKAIVLGVVVAIVLLGLYLKVLSPKRDQASSLKQDITELQSQIDQQKQTAAFAEDARRHFPTYYGRLVVLGKAVPADADTSSLLVELNSIAGRTGVKFNGLQLNADSSSSSPSSSSSVGSTSPTSGTSTTGTSTTGTSTTGTSTTGTSTTGSTSTTATTPSGTAAPTSTSTAGATTPAAATEATAANLPLGAAVGSAGLPTMPYNLTFEGTYFDVANFLKGVDDLVHMRGSSQVAADGRLLTIDGFSLTLGGETGSSIPTGKTDPSNPTLEVTLAVTSYVTPSDQGLTAGATPGGPAPSLSQPQTQPTSATVTP
jgi:Tfp pilus assembly protein PilO